MYISIDTRIHVVPYYIVWLDTPFTCGGRVWCHMVNVFVLGADFLQ